MWPWEHAAIGYLVYSLSCRALGRRPGQLATVAVLLGTQFPDLVDKPLGWGIGLLPSGQSLAHSLLVAVPVSAVVLVVAAVWDRRHGPTRPRTTVAAAFAVGYLSHLPGDVVYSALLGRGLNTDFLLWPLVPAGRAAPVDTVNYIGELLAAFVSFLATPTGRLYLAGELGLLVLAVLVWRADGYPGVRWLFSPGRTAR
jgi:hypothetical protein